MRGLRACFYHATIVYSLDLSRCLSRCVFLKTLSDGKLTNLKRLCVASSWIDTKIMVILLKRTRSLQELDMSEADNIGEGVCEVITEFASHSLKVLYLPDRISFGWYQSPISTMLDSCQELVTLGVDGDMLDAQIIGDILNGLKLKKLLKLRMTDVKDNYVIEVLRTINSNESSRIEVCLCRCPYLKESTTELLRTLSFPLCTQCKYDITTFRWK